MFLFLQEIFSWLSICESVEEINDPLVERLQQKESVNYLLVSRKIPQETFIRCSTSVMVFLFFFKPFLLFSVARLIINEDTLITFLSSATSTAQVPVYHIASDDCLPTRLTPKTNQTHLKNCIFSSLILVADIKMYEMISNVLLHVWLFPSHPSLLKVGNGCLLNLKKFHYVIYLSL